MNKFILQYGGSLVSGITSFLFQFILLSYWTIEEYGYFNLGLSFFILYSVFGNFGIDGILKIKVPLCLENNEKLEILISNISFLKLAIICILFTPFLILISRVSESNWHTILFTTLCALTLLNQFYLDSILQISLKQIEIFIIKLVHGVLKIGGLTLNIYYESDFEEILLWLLVVELVIFIYMYFIRIKFRLSRDTLIECWKERKIARDFNLKTIIDVIISPPTTLWVLALLNFSNKEIGYFAFVINVVTLLTDRLSIFNRLESFMTNFLLREYHKDNKLQVYETFSSWKKFGLMYILLSYSITYLFFEKLDLFFFNGTYKNYYNTILIFLFAKSVSQINYYYTGVILNHKKTALFVRASLIASLVLVMGYLTLFLLNLLEVEYILNVFCLAIISKTIILLSNNPDKRDFYIFNYKLFGNLIFLASVTWGIHRGLYFLKIENLFIEMIIVVVIITGLILKIFNLKYKDISNLMLAGR